MPKDIDNPISTYTERLPQVKRVFHLHSDRIEIEAKWTLGRDHHATVKLGDLAPQYKLLSVRNRWFKKAIMIGSLGAAAAVVFTREGYPDWVQRNALLGWVIAGVCVVIIVMTIPRRRFARFPRKADGRPGLDIFDAGPDRPRFEAFLTEIQKRIRRA